MGTRDPPLPERCGDARVDRGATPSAHHGVRLNRLLRQGLVEQGAERGEVEPPYQRLQCRIREEGQPVQLAREGVQGGLARGQGGQELPGDASQRVEATQGRVRHRDHASPRGRSSRASISR